MKVFTSLSFYLIDFKCYIELLVCIELLIKLWPVAGYRVHKFAYLLEKKIIFVLAIVKKYSSCRIEVILYEIFTIKYQTFSIKITLIKVSHKFYLLILFFALQILFRHIYIYIYISFCIWTINSERFLCDLYSIKKINKKKSDQRPTKIFTCYVILVHLLIKDIFIFTCSNKLKIIHNSLFLFSKFTFKVGYIKMAGKPLPFQWFFSHILFVALIPKFMPSFK